MQNEVEVMRVIRVPPMGALVVHADGGRHKQIASVQNAQAKQRLLAAIGELVTFAGGYDALVNAGVAPALVATGSEAASAANDAEESEALRRRQAAFLEQLERNVHGTSAPQPTLVTSLPPENRPPAEAEELPETDSAPALNLVEQIDRIFQRHLAANGRLANRYIHLRQQPGQLLQIVVDGKVYEHPNDIEDEDVKRALKSALREWEAR